MYLLLILVFDGGTRSLLGGQTTSGQLFFFPYVEIVYRYLYVEMLTNELILFVIGCAHKR